MTSHPSDRPVSTLRQRMIEDMRVHGFAEKTRNDYVRNVRAFAAFIGRSPDTATAEDLRRFQLHQTQIGMQPPSINSAAAALRFFFTVTLDRPDFARRLTIVREPRRLLAVLSVEEVTLLLQVAPGPKYKAALATAYGAGLRVSEVVALKVGDIDSERMLLRVEQGKGRKDRHAMLSPQLLELAARLVDNLILCGPTGVGKSWLACALGHKACRDNRSVLFQRVPKLFPERGRARGDGRYATRGWRHTRTLPSTSPQLRQADKPSTETGQPQSQSGA
jgi:integrase